MEQEPATPTASTLPPTEAEQIPKQPSRHPVISAETHRGVQLVCSSSTIAILADTIDIDDYKAQLHYFWGNIFLLVWNLKTKERQELFQDTVPDFVRDEDTKRRLEMEFDNCYRLFQTHFIGVVEAYGQRWKKSLAYQKFVEVDLHARYSLPNFPSDFMVNLIVSAFKCYRKQKRPKQYPIPPPPQTGQDLLQFQQWEGLEWNYCTAIDFWSFCLPAFETLAAPAKHIGWFMTNEETQDLAFQELGGVALELIRQYCVFEMRSPGGYSLDAHTHALRVVMPGILSEKFMNLYELSAKLGLSAVNIVGTPPIPDYTLAPWAPDDAHFSDEFDKTKTDQDVSISHVSCLASAGQTDSLFNERLKEVDVNVERIDEGLLPVDDVSTRDYEALAQTVKQVEDAISTTFAETLEESLADDVAYITSDHDPAVEDLSVPQLHAPLILDGP